LAQFQVTSDGELKPLDPPAVSIGTEPISLAASPDGKYVYALEDALSQGAYTITFLRFSINNDGTLAPNPVTSPVPSGDYPFTLSPDGRLALVPWGNTVASYSISPSGQFTLASTVPAGSNACTVAIDPTGQFAFVGNFLDDSISEYKIGADGALTPTGTISTSPTAVYFLGFSPEGFLYSIGEPYTTTLGEYSINSSIGTLTEVNDLANGQFTFSFAFDPTGTYAYTANADGGPYSISAFSVDKTNGTLVSNAAAIPTTGAYQIAVDPTGQFVFALGGGTVWQFKIDSTGALVSNGEFPMIGGTGLTSGSITFAQQ
jgi:6-phosphogluconolactonase (cycloisomerase 2 family)